MTEAHHYPTARSVEQAIKDAARRASAADDSLSTSERIQMEPRNRFLSRIFSEGKESDWVLKGGTAMLARLPSSRMTVDIDLLGAASPHSRRSPTFGGWPRSTWAITSASSTATTHQSREAMRNLTQTATR